MQDCGSCKHFLKMKTMKGNSGLCERWDGRTNTDHGHHCKEYKRVKFHRLVESKQKLDDS